MDLIVRKLGMQMKILVGGDQSRKLAIDQRGQIRD
jgi:hypothetical protein